MSKELCQLVRFVLIVLHYMQQLYLTMIIITNVAIHVTIVLKVVVLHVLLNKAFEIVARRLIKFNWCQLCILYIDIYTFTFVLWIWEEARLGT